MKYRLYVSGYCSDSRALQSNMSIGGVILSSDTEKEFSEIVGKGTLLESHVYAIIYGIDEILKNNKVTSIEVYSTNLMIINYINNMNIEIPINAKLIMKKLVKLIKDIEVDIKFEYFEGTEYKYVKNLAIDALEV
ncbi:hypothetical protein H9660_09410 [Clostridium sp. Sa3CUN1]|uniref:RNase H type-1 domain-containing protein n=1 Tax=Clostridium gallinarum TaxID=2762246 RepID=A0ABR8Q4K7_9CLOT|nr:hypothetical protein [Clostridium gallinarum]MBD7915364.1 hypothetical protein [Clostridium gallinarum]